MSGVGTGGSLPFEIVHYGDFIAFEAPLESAFLACPNLYEDPIPCTSSSRTHLCVVRQDGAANESASTRSPSNRASVSVKRRGFRSIARRVLAQQSTIGADGGATESLADDFCTRCTFELLPDHGSDMKGRRPVLYGSIVRLRHVYTSYSVIATDIPMPGAGASRCASFLKTASSNAEVNASLFYVLPRYSMRNEGEPVRTNDVVMFESVQFTDRRLSVMRSLVYSASAIAEDHVSGHDARGWKVVRLRSIHGSAEAHAALQGDLQGGAEDAGRPLLYGGDFVRLWHRRLEGHLIARVDDGHERISKVAPISLVCKKQCRDYNQTVIPLVRPFALNTAPPRNSKKTMGGEISASSLSIWQIVNLSPLDATEVEWMSGVRLRHLVTGQYLCLQDKEQAGRSAIADDTALLVPRSLSPIARGYGRSLSPAPSPQPSPVSRRSISKSPERFSMLASRSVPAGAGWAGSLADLELSTTSDATDPFTLFEILPTITEGTNTSGKAPVPFYSSITLRNRVTGYLFTTNDVAKGDGTWWDYAHDRQLRPSPDPHRDVYRISPVNLEEVRDVIFLLRHRSVLQRAVTQAAPWSYKGDVKDSRFFQMQDVLSSLGEWIRGDKDHDGVIDPAKKSGSSEFCPSQGVLKPNAFQRSPREKVRNDDTSDTPSRVKGVNGAIAPGAVEAMEDTERHRQRLARELAIIELVLQFNMIWSDLARVDLEPDANGLLLRKCPVLRQTARQAYNVLRSVVSGDKPSAITLRELTGVALMIGHVALKWNPPLKEVVLALAAKGTLRYSSTSSLSKQEIYSLVLLVYEACMSKDLSMWPMLELLCTIAVPGDTPDPKAQVFICRMLLGVEMDDEGEDHTNANDPLRNVDKQPPGMISCSSMLFALRENRKSPIGERNSCPKWEIRLQTAGSRRPHYSMPLHEIETYQKEENELLDQLFRHYDQDNSNTIDRQELLFLLEDLGLVKPLSSILTRGLGEELSQEEFLAWWKQHNVRLGTGTSNEIFIASAMDGSRSMPHGTSPSDPAPSMDSIKDALDTYTQRRTSRLFSQANVPVDESAQGIEGSQLEPAAAPDRPFPSVRLVGDAQNDMIDAHPSLWPPSGDQFIAAVSTESHWQSPMPLPSGRQSSFFPVAVDATGEDIQSTSWHDAGDAPDGGWIDICRVLAPRHVTNLFDNIGSGATRVVPASKANDDFHSTAVDSALWLRQCLKILASLCEGSNTVTQSIVRRFAPVDMLLDLFETPSTQQGDRALLLSLLHSIYIRNDLVFSSQPLTVAQADVVAIEVEDFVPPPGGGGLVFNSSTQPGVDDKSSAKQRSRLQGLVVDGLIQLRLDAFAYADTFRRDSLQLQLELMCLVYTLISKGFFYRGGSYEEAGAILPDLKVVVSEADSWADKHLVYASGASSLLSKPPAPTARGSVFYHRDVQRLLLSKCQQASSIHAIHHLAALGGKAGIRTEYQRLFSEQGIAQLKIAVMKALGLLRDIHNLTIFLGALHNVVGPSGVVNILSLEQPSDFLYEHDGAEDRADASAVGLMAALRGVDDEVSAVLDFTLHGHPDLLHHAYKLLQSFSFNGEEFISSAKDLRIAMDPRESYVLRLIRCLTSVIVTHRKEAILLPTGGEQDRMDDDMILTSSHVHELLTAVVSNLEQLCVVPLQWISSHGDEPGKKAAEGRVQHPTQPRSARGPASAPVGPKSIKAHSLSSGLVETRDRAAPLNAPMRQMQKLAERTTDGLTVVGHSLMGGSSKTHRTQRVDLRDVYSNAAVASVDSRWTTMTAPHPNRLRAAGALYAISSHLAPPPPVGLHQDCLCDAAQEVISLLESIISVPDKNSGKRYAFMQTGSAQTVPMSCRYLAETCFSFLYNFGRGRQDLVLKYIHPHLPLFGRASVISPSAMRVLVLIGEALNAAKDMVDFDGSRMAPGSTSICGLGGSMCLLAPLRFESVEVDRHVKLGLEGAAAGHWSLGSLEVLRVMVDAFDSSSGAALAPKVAHAVDRCVLKRPELVQLLLRLMSPEVYTVEVNAGVIALAQLIASIASPRSPRSVLRSMVEAFPEDAIDAMMHMGRPAPMQLKASFISILSFYVVWLRQHESLGGTPRESHAKSISGGGDSQSRADPMGSRGSPSSARRLFSRRRRSSELSPDASQLGSASTRFGNGRTLQNRPSPRCMQAEGGSPPQSPDSGMQMSPSRLLGLSVMSRSASGSVSLADQNRFAVDASNLVCPGLLQVLMLAESDLKALINICWMEDGAFTESARSRSPSPRSSPTRMSRRLSSRVRSPGSPRRPRSQLQSFSAPVVAAAAAATAGAVQETGNSMCAVRVLDYGWSSLIPCMDSIFRLFYPSLSSFAVDSWLNEYSGTAGRQADPSQGRSFLERIPHKLMTSTRKKEYGNDSKALVFQVLDHLEQSVAVLCEGIVSSVTLRKALIENPQACSVVQKIVATACMCHEKYGCALWTPTAKAPPLFVETLSVLAHLQKSQDRLLRGSLVDMELFKRSILSRAAVATFAPPPQLLLGCLPGTASVQSSRLQTDSSLWERLRQGFLGSKVPQQAADLVRPGGRPQRLLRPAHLFRRDKCASSGGNDRLICSDGWDLQIAAVDLGGTALWRQLRGQLLAYVRGKHLALTSSHSEARWLRTKALSDFDEWRKQGGLLIERVISVLPELLSSPCDSDLSAGIFLLEGLQTFLGNDVSELRVASSAGSGRRISRNVEAEVQRLRELQLALSDLGAHIMLMIVIGSESRHLMSLAESLDGSGEHISAGNAQSAKSFRIQHLLPTALEFGAKLMSHGNTVVQNLVIESFEKAGLGLRGTNVASFTMGIREMLRYLRLEMEHLMTLPITREAEEGIVRAFRIFPLVRALFAFLTSMCAGNNFSSKTFMREQKGTLDPANLVASTSLLVSSICQLISSRIRYISCKEFVTNLAPGLPKSDRRRRFIAWHQTEINFKLMRELFVLAAEGFHALTELVQGPIPENQAHCLRPVLFCGPLLEYMGAMHLFLHSRNRSGVLRRWKGGNPGQFFNELVEECQDNPELSSDPEIPSILREAEKWKRIRNDDGILSKLRGNFVNASGRRGQYIQSEHILGVDLQQLKDSAEACEQNLLTFLLGLLEGATGNVVAEVAQQVDCAILLQNMMNEMYRTTALGAHNKQPLERANAKVVLYLTILTSLSEVGDPFHRAQAQTMLQELDRQGEDRGLQTDDLIASVELLGADGSLQQVFFPVPRFVKRYWSYPAVRKARNALVYSVSRDSPDEKILDFYDKMHEVIATMKRQERLHKVFRGFHGLVGGRSATFIPKWFPDLRMGIFFVTLLLNIYLVYESYALDEPFFTDSLFTNDFYSWSGRDTFIGILKLVHLAGSASLLFSQVINSPAISAKRESNESVVITYSYRLGAVLCNASWQIMLLGASLMGFLFDIEWYAIAILDVIPQNRLMSFVLEAVTRNAGKIGVTVTLLLIALYFYAIITYVAWHDQYNFNGHEDCRTILNCWLLHLNYGLLDPPDWDSAGHIKPQVPLLETTDEYAVSFYNAGIQLTGTFFQLSYVLLINLVLGAILSGLVIDVFAEMRAESEAIERDIKERCFICSIDRDGFEQIGVDFNKHIKKEHNMWHYLFFKIYLEAKDPLQYTGPEHHAAKKFSEKSTFVQIMPVHKALALSRTDGAFRETHDLESIYARVKELSESTRSFKTVYKEHAAEVEKDTSKLRSILKISTSLQSSVMALERKLDEMSASISEKTRGRQLSSGESSGSGSALSEL